jgi:hypothetical protein
MHVAPGLVAHFERGALGHLPVSQAERIGDQHRLFVATVSLRLRRGDARAS